MLDQSDDFWELGEGVERRRGGGANRLAARDGSCFGAAGSGFAAEAEESAFGPSGSDLSSGAGSGGAGAGGGAAPSSSASFCQLVDFSPSLIRLMPLISGFNLETVSVESTKRPTLRSV